MTVYSLTLSFPNLEPVCYSMFSSNCCFLTCIQMSQETGRWFGIPISLRVLHSLLRSSQSKALAQSMKQKWMFFLEFSCFFHYPTDDDKTKQRCRNHKLIAKVQLPNQLNTLRQLQKTKSVFYRFCRHIYLISEMDIIQGYVIACRSFTIFSDSMKNIFNTSLIFLF